MLNATFGCDVDYAAGQTIIVFDGETPRDPQSVMDALRAEIARVRSDGFDPALFERQKKASLGARIRGLANFSHLAVGVAGAHFAGFQPLDGFEILRDLSLSDVEAWMRDRLHPDNFAMSTIYPKENY